MASGTRAGDCSMLLFEAERRLELSLHSAPRKASAFNIALRSNHYHLAHKLQLIPVCGPELLELFRGTVLTDFSLERAGLPITQEKCSKMRNISLISLASPVPHSGADVKFFKKKVGGSEVNPKPLALQGHSYQTPGDGLITQVLKSRRDPLGPHSRPISTAHTWWERQPRRSLSPTRPRSVLLGRKGSDRGLRSRELRACGVLNMEAPNLAPGKHLPSQSSGIYRGSEQLPIYRTDGTSKRERQFGLRASSWLQILARRAVINQ